MKKNETENLTIIFGEITLLSCACAAFACGSEGQPIDPRRVDVQILEPQDRLAVENPIRVRMGADHVRIVPEGEGGEGHGFFVLVIDASCDLLGEEVPSDDRHLLMADGGAEVMLHLPLGAHELCLEVVDSDHRVYDGADVVSILALERL